MLSISAAIFSVVLILTGVMKVARPHDVSRALVALGLPRIPGAGTALGVVEVAVGSLALLWPVILYAQACLYLAFAVWVAFALRSKTPIASCGCLGRDDTPPTPAHIVFNVLGVIVSMGAAMGGQPLPIEPGIAGLATVVVVGVGVFLARILLTDAAILVGLRRR
jgi:hypothetical protein